MTGSIPFDDGGVIGGTRAFANRGGSAQVSGAVNLHLEEGIFFDCLWIINVDPIVPCGNGNNNS